ncbi:lipopolysaccharide biosynthesis protein [Caulobacter sp. SLTY]|uniref:GumC family protein n=1 Tax=Caulobacter sp. SLTY TaxID=2683262 RepID=UPI0014125250|nr:GumC family protein [Caulobacter sp. SLTY]NBB15333.1 lipopolysaccharide biosynthesis protein [Caulobacter sp. SLTY]
MATAASTWTMVPHDPPARADWAGRPRYAPSDFVTLLWREKGLMLAVFLLIFLIGAGFAFTLKKSYTAGSSVLVQLGQEYVYEPRAGDAARGAVPDVDGLVASETEILMSAQLRERTLRKLGLGAVYPKAGAEYDAASAADKPLIMAKAVQDMGENMNVAATPANPVVRISFEHDDPVVAARTLNAFLEEYLIYRRTVLIQPASPALERQRALFEDRLGQADAAYQEFLANNNLGDFAATKTSLTQLIGQLEGQKYTIEAELQQRQGRLASLDAQLAQVAPEIGLYRDANMADANKLAELKMKREDLLSRYKPTSIEVQNVEAQIRQLETGMAAGRTAAPGAQRTGVNPVYQTLQTEKIQLAAEIAALRSHRDANTAQYAEATAQLQRMAELEPEFTDLTRDREILQSSVRDFSVKQQQDEAARMIAGETNDNIRIVERASPPPKGASLRRPVLMLAFLFAAFSALCAGLLRMFLRPGMPTPASAARTLDLPVLGAAPVKAR